MSKEYKVQIVHLNGSTFIHMMDIQDEDSARYECEEMFEDAKENDPGTVSVALWDGNQIIDTFTELDGERVWNSRVVSELGAK